MIDDDIVAEEPVRRRPLRRKHKFSEYASAAKQLYPQSVRIRMYPPDMRRAAVSARLTVERAMGKEFEVTVGLTTEPPDHIGVYVRWRGEAKGAK